MSAEHQQHEKTGIEATTAERLKAEFIGDEALRQRYKRYLADRREILATYATAHFRGFQRGERRYRHG